MTREEIETLAQYNAETSRGLVHTDVWRERMVRLQRRFNLETYGTEEPQPGMVYPWPELRS